MEKGNSGAQRRLYRDSNLQVVFGITLTAVLGVASITPAFPLIISEFRISPQQVGLLITVFTLPGVFLAPLLGVFADRVGRKRILVPLLLLFGLAGGACMLARSFTILLVLRFFQGIGASALGSLNVTIIGDLYSGRQRAEAMGYNASVLSVGTASYPVIGGALATFAWYYPFALPLLALPFSLVVLRILENPEPRSEQNLGDYLNAAWRSVRNRQVIGLFAVSVLTFIILYGSFLTYLPLLIDQRFGGTSLVIGLIMATSSFTTAITSAQLGRLTRHFKGKYLLLTAFSSYGVGMFIVPFLPNLWALTAATFLFGLGQGLNIPIVQTLLAEKAPLEQRAAIMSLNGMVLRLGQTLGPVLSGIAYGIWGLDGAFFTGSVAALLLLAIVLGVGIGNRPLEETSS